METGKLIGKLCFYGFRDCFIGVLKIWDLRHFRVKKYGNKTVGFYALISQVFSCLCLNGIALGLLVYLLEDVLTPYVTQFTQQSSGFLVREWLLPILLWIFCLVWKWPLFVIMRIANCVLFQDMADIAYEMACGPIRNKQSFSSFWSDFVNGVVVQTLFFLQKVFVAWLQLTFISELLCILHMSLLYSLYAFDYKWSNHGWALQRRIGLIDVDWPYFLGFGLPLALVDLMTNSIIYSGCLFSVLFPFWIISAANTTPVIQNVKICRLHIFSPVIYLFKISLKYGLMFCDYLRRLRLPQRDGH